MSKRLKFFFGHSSISLCVALLSVYLVFLLWYQYPLAMAVGVVNIFLVLLVVDIVLGPVLGFIVYKEGKKTLKFDLGVIIFFQIFALCYGIYSIEQGRPAYIAYNIDRFELVRKNEIASIDSQHNKKFGSYPSYVAVQHPEDPKLKEKMMFDEVFGGISLSQRPEFYQVLDSAKQQMKDKVLSLNDLSKYNEALQVDKILSKYPTAIGFFPLKANNLDMTVLVDKEYKVIKIVDLRPWS